MFTKLLIKMLKKLLQYKKLSAKYTVQNIECESIALCAFMTHITAVQS